MAWGRGDVCYFTILRCVNITWDERIINSPYLSFCKNKQGKREFLTISSKYIRRPQKRDHQTHPVYQAWKNLPYIRSKITSIIPPSPLGAHQKKSEICHPQPPIDQQKSQFPWPPDPLWIYEKFKFSWTDRKTPWDRHRPHWLKYRGLAPTRPTAGPRGY